MMKTDAVASYNEPDVPRELIPKLPPDLQKALSEKESAEAYTLLVFWNKGFRMPGNTGERKLICSDGTEIAPRPIGFNAVLHSSLETGAKPTGEEYVGACFWVLPDKKPVAMRIGGTQFSTRWATREEAMRTGSWMEPDIILRK